MRTTLNVDEDLLDAAVRITGAATKGKAVNEALREFVRRRSRELLLGLEGQVEVDETWKSLRRLEVAEVQGRGDADSG